MLKSVLILIFTTAHVCGYLREDCVCGVANTESRRITNGNVVKPFRYPWMVAIFNAHKKAFCGGSLISDRHVLTAAHCVSWENRFAPNYWRYLYGKIKSHHIDYGEGMNFDAIFVHPKFKSHGTFDDYDLAILRFRLAIRKFSKKVRPICVPNLNDYSGGMKATITGWGTHDSNVMQMSTLLKEGEIDILHPLQCPIATNLHNHYNFESMICGYSSMHVDTCQGDSGGPLFTQVDPTNHDLFQIVGVSSFGESCGKNHAGVYADVTQSLPWIWSVITSAGICPRPEA